jgi:integrase
VRELFSDLRQRGVTTSGLVKLRAALSAMFATAVEDNAVRTNPVRGVRVPQAADQGDEEEQAKALTREELSILLGQLPDDWRLFFELLAHTGLRISEAIGLTWQHVELGAKPRLLVREQFYRGERRRLKSKYGKRDVPLSAGMARRLAELRRDTYRGDKASVFATATGTELNPSNIAGRVLKPAAIGAGLLRPEEAWKKPDEPESWVSFHTFRHTCASLLFAGGKNIKQVQEWLGHADPAFTLRCYVHLMDEGLGGADFLDQAVAVGAAARGEVASGLGA